LLSGALRLTACLVFSTIAFAAAAQTQSFEELIDEVLRRHGGQEAPQGQLAAPGAAIPQTPGALEQGAPQSPTLVPVEPGPRPYTPPKVDRAETESPPAPAAKAEEPAANAAEQTAPPQPPAPAPKTVETPAPEQASSPPEVSSDQPASTIDNPSGDAAAAIDPTAATAERTRESLTVEEVNAAVFSAEPAPPKGASPLVLKVQVLLDRAGASPGVIDAYSGGNFGKAISAVETVLGLPADGVLDQAVWDALGGDSAAPVLVPYTITAEDLSYQFAEQIPEDYAEQAKLSGLGYTTPQELFGERFHMDVKLLRALNPEADFRRAGSVIWVTAVEAPPLNVKVARIVADKTLRQVRGYDAENRLIVAYPATIGSTENPSPTGDHVVKAIAPNPIYYYDPANFLQAGNTEKLKLPPGPNSPVGTVWIDLTEPSYGIHGTPEPSKVDKSGSHGCVRLTNWDAEELASLVEPGVVVSFTE
jgi:lipoprotein-anchoring transpeptidase ErfK/SrfK